MAGRKYTDDQLAQAAELRESRLTFRQIGARLGMSASAACWHCLRLGADSPKTRAHTNSFRGPMRVRRGNHVVRRFSPEEDRQLVHMELSGARVIDMARTLGRKPNSVRGRLMILARHEARAEAADLDLAEGAQRIATSAGVRPQRVASWGF